MSAEDRRICPKCDGIAPLITPMKVVPKEIAVYACPACGNVFQHSGSGLTISDASSLDDAFKSLSRGETTLTEVLKGIELNHAQRAMLLVHMAQDNIQSWFDGLKVGIIQGLKQYGKVRNEQRGSAPEPSGRGVADHDESGIRDDQVVS